MPPERLAEVRAWLQKASVDLRAARHAMTATPPITEYVLFSAQQAVEKALKAFLTMHEEPFPKTHDLDRLAQGCERIDPMLRGLLQPARDLTAFAWAFRYPGDPSTPGMEEAEAGLILATQVYDAIVDRLPDSSRP